MAEVRESHREAAHCPRCKLAVQASCVWGSQVEGRTGKKGSDKGMDGVIAFIDDAGIKPKQVIVPVKSGKAGFYLSQPVYDHALYLAGESPSGY